MLRKVCGVCRFPRVFLQAEDEGREEPLRKGLAEARRHAVLARSASLAAAAVAASGLLLAGLAALVAAGAKGAAAVIAVAAVGLLVAAVSLRRRGAAARAAAESALDGAYRQGTQSLLEERRAATEIAARVGVELGDAERLLAEAAALTDARIAVDEAGGVHAVPAGQDAEVLDVSATPPEGARGEIR